jgi:ubiquinone biosynthesis protein COQ9
MTAKADERLRRAREAVLDAALTSAASRGWTRGGLEDAVAAAGIDAPLAARAFPRGVADLVMALDARFDRKMTEALGKRDLNEVRYGERVGIAISLRFEAMEPVREAARHAVAFHALPQNAADGAKCLAVTADAIWRALGDTSADFSFYTKRATLAAVLAATTLVWLDDAEGGAWPAFLDRRLKDVLAFRKFRTRVEDAVARTAQRVAATIRRGFPAGLPGLRGKRPAFFRFRRR